MPDTDLMTAREVSSWLRVRVQTVYEYIGKGMPSYRIGTQWRFKRVEVEAWMKAQAEATSPHPGPHISVRPNGARRERGLAVGEAVAKLKSFVPGRGR